MPIDHVEPAVRTEIVTTAPCDRVWSAFTECVAPGCTSRRHLDRHHVVYQSHGGGHEGSNRCTGCRFHHLRGEHQGLASVRGKAPLDLVWKLGRGGIGGTFRNERRV